MSKFRNWLEEWFGIPAEDDHGSDSTLTTPIVSEKSSEFHVLRVQPTPNPNAFQFVINAPIISTGTKTFTNTDEAKGDSLAEALFQIYGVENIYLKESFVTITKSETVGWHTVFEKIGETIEEKIHHYDALDEKEVAADKPETILDKFHKEDFQNCNVKEKCSSLKQCLIKLFARLWPMTGAGLTFWGLRET